MNITLRFFASIREQLNCSEEVVSLPVEITTVGQVLGWLVERGGVWADTLADNPHLRMACQHEFCDGSTEITEGSEVAFFPPVTGG